MSEGFKMTALPIASADAVWIKGWANGSEDDVIRRTTPTGSYR